MRKLLQLSVLQTKFCPSENECQLKCTLTRNMWKRIMDETRDIGIQSKLNIKWWHSARDEDLVEHSTVAFHFIAEEILLHYLWGAILPMNMIEHSVSFCTYSVSVNNFTCHHNKSNNIRKNNFQLLLISHFVNGNHLKQRCIVIP